MSGSKQREWRLATKQVRSGTRRSEFGETSEALFLNSGFCYDSAETAENRFNGVDPGFIYSRYSNPTLKMLEERIADIEQGGRACVMASGMAAVFASLMCQLQAGDHVIGSRALFGSCYYIMTQLLPRYGITVTLVDGTDLAAWQKAFTPKTKCVFIESPSNPTLELVDIRAVAELCKQQGACLIVDNIFASPLLQHPLQLGADVVVYSTTKHMDGQGRTLGGAVVGSDSFIEETLLPFHRHTGPAMSTFVAWVVLKGLETLDLRMERHGRNAQMIAEYLERHPNIETVRYPGLLSHPQYTLARKQMKGGGNMIAFTLKGGKQAAFKFMNGLQIVDISNNLGDAKSLITHPFTTTHSNIAAEEKLQLGISEGLVRMSVGIEDGEDLREDIEQALLLV